VIASMDRGGPQRSRSERTSPHPCFQRTWLILCAATLLGGCASKGPLWSKDEPPRLLDGEVRMTTKWEAGEDAVPDVREIVCRDGRITATYDGRLGRREGDVAVEDWERLWRNLEPVAPWASHRFTVEPDDPQAGPYHVVSMRVGERTSAFSSQLAAGFIQLATQSGSARLAHSNVVVDFTSAHAVRETRKGPASRPAGASSKPAPATR
jgi:hypothetical protein